MWIQIGESAGRTNLPIAPPLKLGKGTSNLSLNIHSGCGVNLYRRKKERPESFSADV